MNPATSAKFKYDSKILVVGHEPFLTKMAADIVSSSSSPITSRSLRSSTSHSNPNLGFNKGNHHSIVLKRSGLARISTICMNPKLKGELPLLLTPMLLKRISSLTKTSKKKKGKKNQKIFQYPPITSSFDSTTTSKTKSAETAINQ